jgi:hypothetical protein
VLAAYGVGGAADPAHAQLVQQYFQRTFRVSGTWRISRQSHDDAQSDNQTNGIGSAELHRLN